MRCAFTIAAVALLAGCGVSQLPAAAPISLQSASAAHGVHAPSWMLPEAKHDDLVYVSGLGGPPQYASAIWVFSYPQGKLVGTLTGFDPYNALGSICTDSHGNVYVTGGGAAGDSGEVYVFAHGSITLETTLSDPGSPFGCAVDPKTGDLAVTNYFSEMSGTTGDVAIYAGSKGTPKTHTAGNITNFFFCAYDDHSNLFVDGTNDYQSFPFAELSKGSTSFSNVALSTDNFWPGSLQWHDNALVVAALPGLKSPTTLYRVHFSGSTGSIVGKTLLDTAGGYITILQYWVQGDRLIGLNPSLKRVNFWHYPAGGYRYKELETTGSYFSGAAVSVAP